ncbi:MAG: hypothetical protein ACI39H_02005 [Lachnospiraceae bacterium]
MTEPEVSLYIAMYYIKNGLTKKNVQVSIDGAHVKTKSTINFDIWKFFSENDYMKLDSDADKWQGEYEIDGLDAHIVISSTPGIGDVKIETLDGKSIVVESKKGKNDKKGLEYPMMREAIGQLMTNEYAGEYVIPVVGVPYSEKSYELATRWIKLPQIQAVGIKFFLVKEDGNIVTIDK